MTIFCCAAENDLYRACRAGGGRAERISEPAAAVTAAPPGGAVLVLADGYPQQRTEIPAAVLDAAAAKGLRLYVEFPAAVPGLVFDEPRTVTWERLVVNDRSLAPDLPDHAILAAHACVHLPTTGPGLVSIARVAGYDRAEFGLPDDAVPALLERPGMLVATTKLSHFRTGRYAPAESWTALWQGILAWLEPAAEPANLQWTPTVTATFPPEQPIGPDEEATALRRFVHWHLTADLLLTADGERVARELIPGPAEAVARDRLPLDRGDGRHGMLEGYESQIHPDGSQYTRVSLRADCVAEAAMVLATTDREAPIAANLLDFVYTTSGLCGGVRADADHPAYGHIGWGTGSTPWETANYGDDNARVILASLLVGARLDSDRWLEPVLRAILANLRTTGRRGFRGDRIDLPELTANGWRHYHDRDYVNLSSHFETWLWACYLWAYQATGRTEYLDCATTGLTAMMAAFPTGWRRNDVTERSRILLPLAWLVRVRDTPTHREWLAAVVEDLVRDQQPDGAIGERELGGPGHFQAPQRNEEYGETESPLIHRTGDPASDQLYTTGFALIGLHEAAAATGDAGYAERADRLAGYLVRIQTASADPRMDGTWLRAFDYRRWDFWASSADLGWGAWCAEVGWAPAWTGLSLALRRSDSSLWTELAAVRPDPDLAERLWAQLLGQLV